MKTNLLILVLIVLSLLASGQTYQSIFSEGITKWNVYECAPDAGGTIAYYSSSDTVINDKLYHKLFRELIFTENQEVGQNGSLCGYVHEDTLSGKYWFMKNINGQQKEALFMDFSLKTGDSLAIVTDFRYMWTDSVHVDTIYTENNRKVIEIDLSIYKICSDMVKVRFIEGIGSTNGFYMAEDYEQTVNYTLLCKDEDGKNVFNEFGSCFKLGGANVKNIHFEKSINLYPNPANWEFKIECLNYSNLKYQIFNNLGKQIACGEMTSNLTDIKLTEKGMLFIVITNEDYIVTKKIINNGY